MKKIITQKNIFITLAIIALSIFTIPNTYIFSQPKEAFEVIYLPIEDEGSGLPDIYSAIKYENSYTYGGFTYFKIFLGGMSVMNNKTKEFKFILRMGGEFANGVRYPYKNDIFWKKTASSKIKGDAFIVFRLNTDATIEFIDTIYFTKLPDTTWSWEAAQINKHLMLKFNFFPPPALEKYYTEKDLQLYYFEDDNLVKIDPNNPSHHIYTHTDSLDKSYTFWIIPMADSSVWYHNSAKGILRFDEKDNSVNYWDTLTIDGHTVDIKSEIKSMFLAVNVDTPTNSKIYIHLNSPKDTLLVRTKDGWEFEELKLMKVIANEFPDVQIYRIYNWSDDELAYTLQGDKYSKDISFYENGVPILIYNHRTKQERMIRIPLDAFENGIVDMEHIPSMFQNYVGIESIADYEDGKKAIIIGSHMTQNMLIIYDPAKDTTVGITDTDAGAIPDLWIRSIYPNPASHKITADIMCFLPDFNDVEIGLYNLMGQKLLDLSNRFEYNDATHTILVGFEVPPELTKGVYYLNIRNSNEIRTKAIVID
ncbi:MAG: T9SS type A sorting domain-containing protein [Ignavibacteria bacterium]|jgi:hypothetical protein|nr:T9SS type A sorting domain-containing protein [Ignavibacteria bacterium]